MMLAEYSFEQYQVATRVSSIFTTSAQ